MISIISKMSICVCTLLCGQTSERIPHVGWGGVGGEKQGWGVNRRVLVDSVLRVSEGTYSKKNS